MATQKQFLVVPKIRTDSALEEKRLKVIGVRVGDSLHAASHRRASTKGLTLSQHVVSLLVADLQAQRKRGRTLFNMAPTLHQLAELVQQGIESDAQRLYVLRKIAAFERAVLEVA